MHCRLYVDKLYSITCHRHLERLSCVAADAKKIQDRLTNRLVLESTHSKLKKLGKY